jgi:antitoxin component YwqK of YwqJK toxin-antitoxin module
MCSLSKLIYWNSLCTNKLILKVSTSYYKTGQISYKVEYDAKGLNSRKSWWHNNGNRSKMITFKNGQIDGVWITWSYDGIKTRERLYKNGSMINERVY